MKALRLVLLVVVVASPLAAQTAATVPLKAALSTPTGKPDATKFTDWDTYQEALIDWKILSDTRLGAGTAAAQIGALKTQLAQMEKRLAQLESASQSLQTQTTQNWSALYDLKHDSAVFDPASPSRYLRIDTAAGALLVSLEKVEPYLDGVRVDLQIGNPTSTSFQGFELNARWARRFKEGEGSWFDWATTRKAKKFVFTTDIVAARWNNVQLILPETKPADFGNLEVQLSTNVVSLGKAY